ncbi:MAG TPA: hypothetical protein VM840_04875, partial [Actinomycetota bacterium]|nr:hypothetical protein [Actinomycetota bacterium]
GEVDGAEAHTYCGAAQVVAELEGEEVRWDDAECEIDRDTVRVGAGTVVRGETDGPVPDGFVMQVGAPGELAVRTDGPSEVVAIQLAYEEVLYSSVSAAPRETPLSVTLSDRRRSGEFTAPMAVTGQSTPRTVRVTGTFSCPDR